MEKAIALTALEEFWLPARKTIFLGEWCKVWSRREAWSGLDHDTLPYVWADPARTAAAIEECAELYPRVLQSLTTYLNAANGTRLEARYFHVLLGNWLLHFMHQAYDKLLVLEQALAGHGDIPAALLDPLDEYVAIDVQDYFVQIFDDAYNHQLFSQMLRLRGIEAPSARLRRAWTPAPFGRAAAGRELLKRFLFRTSAALTRALHGSQHLTLVEPYVVYGETARLLSMVLRSGFTVAIDYMSDAHSAPPAQAGKRREPLQGLRQTELERTVAALVPANLPRVFLEGYSATRAAVLDSRRAVGAAYFTANALHTNTTAKFFFSEYRERIRLLCQVHGGGYGLDLLHTPERYERSVADIFYTCGYPGEPADRVLPMGKFGVAANLERRQETRTDILLAVNEFPRYTYRLHFHPMGGSSAFQLRALEEFIDRVEKRDALLLRVHPGGIGYGWDLRARLVERFTALRTDPGKVTLTERLRNCRLFVSDTAGTAWLEALAANVPTICFFDSRFNRFRPHAEHVLRVLREAGVLYSTAADAAAAVNALYPRISEWWNSSSVQQARGSFVEQYANGRGWVRAWLDEFSRVLHEPGH